MVAVDRGESRVSGIECAPHDDGEPQLRERAIGLATATDGDRAEDLVGGTGPAQEVAEKPGAALRGNETELHVRFGKLLSDRAKKHVQPRQRVSTPWLERSLSAR